MKKLIIMASLLASGSVMSASGDMPGGGNLYLGLQAGPSATIASSKLTSGAGTADANIGDMDLGKHSLTGGIYLGYRTVMEGISLGLEIDYRLNGGKMETFLTTDTTSNPHTITAIEIEQKNYYSVSLLAGVPLSEQFEVYGRLGYAQSKFEAKGTNVDMSENLQGPVFGVGMSYMIDAMWSVRGNYYYTHYSKKDDLGTTLNELKARQHNFMVGVDYRF